MLSFAEYIAEEKKAKAYVAKLLEIAGREKKFELNEEEQGRMKDILKMFPTILERTGPEHTTFLPSKKKPSLEGYDRSRKKPLGGASKRRSLEW